MWTFTPAAPADLVPALELVFACANADERRRRIAQLLHLADEGVFDPRGLVLARRAGALCGVQVCLPLGGASWLFWLPVVRAGEPAELADRLVCEGLQRARADGAKLAHALLPTADVAGAVPLVRQGFTWTTRLHYLHHDLDDVESAGRRVRLEPYSEANAAAFRDTLSLSYEGTLDCPELNGLRTVDEVLAGYRAATPSRPGRWWLAYDGDAPAGVLILTDIPEGPALDLSYVGVVPGHRSRGIGRALVRHALVLAQDAEAVQLLLAVDERNAPARRLYGSLGFAPGEMREVYLKPLAPDRPG